jgi:hypothetical protein
VVTCGRDKEYSRLVAIVSQPAGFAVTTLDSSEATHPKEQTYDGETGLWLFLMAVTGEQIQPLGEAPVSVHGNAFQVVFYDKGTSAYVFENGRFTEYMTGD